MDMLVEDRHFRRDWSTAFDIGGKAAAQNLADVAAMGASPTALLVGFAAPGDLPVAWAQDLTRGLVAECSRAGAFLAGGDVSSADKITLAITALGDLAGREPVTRAGARPGDQLALAGRLGHSAAGLALLEAGLTEPARADRQPPAARDRPYEAGPQAAALGATSMIDISDGLLADLGHVAQASGVRIDVETARLEDSRLTAAAAALAGADWLRWALTGGEDHALAATFPAAQPLGRALASYRNRQRGGGRAGGRTGRTRGRPAGSISPDPASSRCVTDQRRSATSRVATLLGINPLMPSHRKERGPGPRHRAPGIRQRSRRSESAAPLASRPRPSRYLRMLVVTPQFAAAAGIVIAAMLAVDVPHAALTYGPNPPVRECAEQACTPAQPAPGRLATSKPSIKLKTSRPKPRPGRRRAAGTAGTSGRAGTAGSARGQAAVTIEYRTIQVSDAGFVAMITVRATGSSAPGR